MTEAVEQTAHLQQLCRQAYELLINRWPSWEFGPLVFDETSPCGEKGDWIWFCGDVYREATAFRYVCIARPVLEYQGYAPDFEIQLCTFSHNSYLDLLFIYKVMTAELDDPDLFRRDRPPPIFSS